jgi:hypothetical protein
MVNVRLLSVLGVAILVITCLCLLVTFTSLKASAAPVGYLYEVDHAITASPDGALNSAIMSLLVYNSSGTNGNNVLYVGSNCRSDFNDIWINDSTDTVTFPHWINWSASDGNHIFLEYNISNGVPHGGTTVKIYYGYTAANNHENRSGVYTLYDDFNDGVIDSSLWFSQNTVTEADGVITITQASTGSASYLISKQAIPDNSKVELVLKTGHHDTSCYEDVGYVGAGYITAYFTAPEGVAYRQSSGTESTASIVGWSAGSYHSFSIARDGGSKFVVDNTPPVSITTNYPTDKIELRFEASKHSTTTPIMYVDIVKVSPYTTSPPTDGSWGVPNSDILQTVPFTLIEINPLSLRMGGVIAAQVTVTDINGNTIRSGSTGSDGTAAFQLYRNTYYNIKFVKADYGIDKTWSGYPADANGYTVYVWPWDYIWSPGAAGQDDEYKKIDAFITATLNASDDNNGDITVYYNDTGAHTTTTTINVYKRLNMTNDQLIATYTTAINNFSQKFTILDAPGEDYKVTLTAENTYYGTVKRTYTWTFPGIRYNIPGLPASAYVWIGFIIPVFVALTASMRNVKFGPIVFCAMSWGFNTLGWMNQLGVGYTLALAIGTFFSVLYIFNLKAKEGGY